MTGRIHMPTFGKAQRAAESKPQRSRRRAFFLDARRASRQRMVVPGKLVFDGGMRSLDCTIGDMSTRGARVRVGQESASALRDVWLVHLKEWHAYEARIVWRRKDGNIGLAFRRSFELEGAISPDLRAMREHCVAHNYATLRRL
jgi:hypothetical protein